MSESNGSIERRETEETLAITRMRTILHHAKCQSKKSEQVEDLTKKREHAFRLWQSCIRLAWRQVELGGTFYIEQPHTCMCWRLQGNKTRYLLDPLSTYCIRDQCFDGLTHPKSGLPAKKATMIQTNDSPFATQFAQRCIGHDYDHAPIEGSQVIANAAFYPKKFCQRAVQLWKSSDETTPNHILTVPRSLGN